MRERALIHVGGPEGSGKTAFVETLLEALDVWVLAARCVRDDSLQRPRESAPKADPELRRYRGAGAQAAAVFRFPENGHGFDAFFESNLMAEFSDAVFLEGDDPLGSTDLDVFVAPVLAEGDRLFARVSRARQQRERVEQLDRILADPLGELLGLDRAATIALGPRFAEIVDAERARLAPHLEQLRRSPPKERKRWAIAERMAGIERAGLVVVNVRSDENRRLAERLVADVARLRKEKELFDDVLGPRGSRTPITAVVADVSDPRDPGTKKAIARVRRSIRSTTS